MADEDVKPGRETADEEFHFTDVPEEDVGSAFTSPKKSSGLRFGGINRRNIFIIIGALVVGFALYKLTTTILGIGRPRIQPAQVQRAQPTLPKIARAPAPVPPISAPPPAPALQPLAASSEVVPQLPAKRPSDNSVNQQLQNFQDRANQSDAMMQNMQKQVNDLQQAVSRIQESINTTNQQLRELNETLAKQNAIIVHLEARQKTLYRQTIVQKQVIATVPPPVYYIAAMIPRRAWLITPDGRTFTIAIGDKLTGYGVIRDIIPPKGIVRTSSGIILRYRPNEI